jgi:hypothetical protein
MSLMRIIHPTRALLTTSALLLGVVSSLAPGAVWAHDDAYLDSVKAPHGGQLRMAGPLHLELVLTGEQGSVQARPVVVYVTDHAGKALSTQGAGGQVTLLVGQRKVEATLQPDGENRLKGSAQYTPQEDIKAIVRVQLAGQSPQQARFMPLSKRRAGSAEGAHQH